VCVYVRGRVCTRDYISRAHAILGARSRIRLACAMGQSTGGLLTVDCSELAISRLFPKLCLV